MAADTNLTIGHNLLPKTSGNINLGDSTHKWVIDASQLSGSVDASKLGGTAAASVLPNSGVTAGNYGPSANASPAHGAGFSVPYVTVDAKGRVTAAATRTITLPADSDTKNTAGSTDTSSKIYLVGATSQAANPQTYSDNEIYATSGVLTTKKVQVGGTAATIEYDSTNKCINFVFA